jgi:hypothetical protein
MHERWPGSAKQDAILAAKSRQGRRKGAIEPAANKAKAVLNS